MYVWNGFMDVRFYSCLIFIYIYVYGCFNVLSKKKLLNFYCRCKVCFIVLSRIKFLVLLFIMLNVFDWNLKKLWYFFLWKINDKLYR